MKRYLSDDGQARWDGTTLVCARQGEVAPPGSELLLKGCMIPDLGGMEGSGMPPHCAYRDVDQSHYPGARFDVSKTTVDASYLLPSKQMIALAPYGSSAEYSAVSPSQLLSVLAGSNAMQAVVLPNRGLTAYSYSWD